MESRPKTKRCKLSLDAMRMNRNYIQFALRIDALPSPSGLNKNNGFVMKPLFLVETSGLEPLTPCMSSKYSNQLSYASECQQEVLYTKEGGLSIGENKYFQIIKTGISKIYLSLRLYSLFSNSLLCLLSILRQLVKL